MALAFKTLKTGAAGAPVFLLLHGFGGFADVWADIAQGLESTVLAVDLPGHGAHMHHEAGGRAGAMASAIAEALAAAHLPPVQLCGHSMGGAVASLIAAQNPHLVASLLLLAPGGYGPEIDCALLRGFAAAGDEAEIKAALQAMCTPQFAIPQEVIADALAFRAQAGQLDRLIAIGARMTKNNDQGVIPAAMLAEIKCPARILWGREDALLPMSQIFHAPASFEPLVLEGIGHMLIEEAPDMVIQHLKDMAAR